MEGVEVRSLPVFGAGDVEVPYAISGMGEELTQETRWEEHSHPTHELLCNERGASTATVGNRVWSITPSLGLWLPAGTLHSGHAGPGTVYRTAQFRIHVGSRLPERITSISITPLLRLLLDRLVEPGLPDDSRELTEAVIVDVLEPAATALFVTVPSNPLLQPIVDALDADPADPRTLDAWAEEAGVSARTITRAFESGTGLGFVHWRAAVRAQRAVRLLADGLYVDEAARLVGYSSASAFVAAFRRTTGLTPGQFLAETR